jgi:putative phosphoserine phosphatase / 1-acylglycerol-3-phosphate O-acyltransferase
VAERDARYGSTMPRGAAFFDLDRTILAGASGPVISESLRAEGVLRAGSIPGERLLFSVFNAVGETLPSMLLTRQGARAARGWPVEAVRAAAERAAGPLLEQVLPYARQLLVEHRDAGRPVVLATTTPHDLIAPFAEAAGFDDVLATRYRIAPDGTYAGSIDGEFVWFRGKARLVRTWAERHGVDLSASHAYSDSVFDTPMLEMVGHPTAVNPDPQLAVYAAGRRWPVLWFDAPPGVPRALGVEPQQVLQQFTRPELFPWVRFDLDGVDRVPADGGALLALNHRSYLDPLAVGFLAARRGRPARFLAKKEVTDAPIVGPLTRAMGAIRVDRGSGSDTPLEEAARALRAGELVVVFPQGTIPRGEAFFDPELRGRWGAARLARETGTPVVPAGIWGSEKAWPRSSRLPYILNLAHPPVVRVRVGEPFTIGPDEDLERATATIMGRIADLLPPEARQRSTPSAAQLAATFPPGHRP